MKLYKFLCNDNTGGYTDWSWAEYLPSRVPEFYLVEGKFPSAPPLPEDSPPLARIEERQYPGPWTPEVFPLKLCERGYHLAREGQLLTYFSQERLYEAEGRGEQIETDDQVVVESARLMRRVAGWNQEVLMKLSIGRVQALFDANLLDYKRYRSIQSIQDAIDTARDIEAGFSIGRVTEKNYKAARDSWLDAAPGRGWNRITNSGVSWARPADAHAGFYVARAVGALFTRGFWNTLDGVAIAEAEVASIRGVESSSGRVPAMWNPGGGGGSRQHYQAARADFERAVAVAIGEVSDDG